MNNVATEKARFYEIDMLRFLAALSVVFFHYTFRGFAADNLSPLEYPVLGSIFKYGYLGVDLFFIISGFVILLTAYNGSATQFVTSRLVRLYPAFWASVTITAFVIAMFGEPRYSVELKQYIYNLSMISRFFGIKHVDGVYWSLLVEMKFYFLIFLIITLQQIQKIKYYLGLWLAATITCRLTNATGLIDFFLIPEYAPYFIAGAAFYLMRLEGPSIYKILIIAISYILAMQNAIVTDGFVTHYKTDISPIIVGGWITIFYIIFTFIALGKTSFINRKAFIKWGSLTYPLYLIHQNIGYIFFQHLNYDKYKYILLASMITLSLTGAYLINTHVEKRYSKRFKLVLENIALRILSWRKTGKTNV